MCQDPDRPSLESRHMRFFCIGLRCGNDVAICINLFLRGCIVQLQEVRSSLWPICFPVYASSNGYPLRCNTWYGWLASLTQQGLSPCKKYKTSWRSSVFGFWFLKNSFSLFVFSFWFKKIQSKRFKTNYFLVVFRLNLNDLIKLVSIDIIF